MSLADRRELDEAAFLRHHGKRPMGGEIGCYMSHLDALRQFVESDAGYAAIFEDDAQLPTELSSAIAEIAAVDDWDLVKLMHHRSGFLRARRQLASTDRVLGTIAFGPTGSSAAYLVNRAAAQRLLDRLLPMSLPFDVALERGWSMGLRVRHISPDLVRANPSTRKTLIGGPIAYKRHRLPAWRRVPTLFFRTSEAVRRAVYAWAS